MSVALLGLDLYFAAMLGVSGLAKVDQPARFMAALYRYRLFPAWSIPFLVRIVTLIELVVAASLVAGTLPVVTAVVTCVLFGCFLVIRTVLVVTKRGTDCGCYGGLALEKVGGAS